MPDIAWDATASLTLPYHPDAATAAHSTVDSAVREWAALAPRQQADALLLWQETRDAPARVLNASALARLAADLPA